MFRQLFIAFPRFLGFNLTHIYFGYQILYTNMNHNIPIYQILINKILEMRWYFNRTVVNNKLTEVINGYHPLNLSVAN